MVGVDRLVESVEEEIRCDNLREMVTVQIRSEVGFHMREHQCYPAVAQILLKIPYHLSGRVVHMGNRAGVHNEPAHRRRRRPGKTANLIGEHSGVGIEEGRAKSVDHQPQLRYGSWKHGGQLPDTPLAL